MSKPWPVNVSPPDLVVDRDMATDVEEILGHVMKRLTQDDYKGICRIRKGLNPFDEGSKA